MTDTTIGAEEIADIQVRVDYAKEYGRDDVAVDVEPLQALLDLASRALPAAPDVGDEKPVAYMRRCAYEKNEGTRGNRPRGWQYHATSVAKILDDDVPLLEPSQVARIREQARREVIAEIAEIQKLLDELHEDMQARTKAGMSWGGGKWTSNSITFECPQDCSS